MENSEISAKIGSVHIRLRSQCKQNVLFVTEKLLSGQLPGIILQEKEAQFLRILLSGHPASDQQLLGSPTPAKLRTLDRHMDHIRCKLRDCGAGVSVRRIHSWGYILVEVPDEVA